LCILLIDFHLFLGALDVTGPVRGAEPSFIAPLMLEILDALRDSLTESVIKNFAESNPYIVQLFQRFKQRHPDIVTDSIKTQFTQNVISGLTGFWEKIVSVYQAWSKPPMLICAMASPTIGAAVVRAILFKYHPLMVTMNGTERALFLGLSRTPSGTENHILEFLSALPTDRLPLAFTFFQQCTDRSFLNEVLKFAIDNGSRPHHEFPLFYAYGVRICWAQPVHGQFIERCMSFLRQNTDPSQAQPMIEARSVIAANKDLVPLLTDQNYRESAELCRNRPSNFGTLEYVSNDPQIAADVQLLNTYKLGGKAPVVHKPKTYYCPYCGGRNLGESDAYTYDTGVLSHLTNKSHLFICKRAPENSCRMRFHTETERKKHERNECCRPLSAEDKVLLQRWEALKIAVSRSTSVISTSVISTSVVAATSASSTSTPTELSFNVPV
jgi:hypothetical protein